MLPSPSSIVRLLLTGVSAAAALSSTPVCAQIPEGFPAEDDDPIEETQFWIDIIANYDLGDGLAVSTQINPRIQLDERQNDQLFLRLGLDWQAADFVRVGGGMITLGEYDPTEIRPYNYVDLGDGPVTVRTMAEYRFFSGADRMELRIRQRLQLSQPVAERTNLIASGEIFYSAIQRDRSQDPRITQWRAIAGVQHRINDHARISVAYLALGSPRPRVANRLAHIPTLGFTYNF